jgi:lipopolysaccharide transport system permease protein
MSVAAPGDDRVVVIRPSQGVLGRSVRDLWPFRELAYFLVWRDVKVRYKQTVLGAAWAVIQPLMLMVVFSVFLGHFANLPSRDIPYPLFTFAALVPWTLFNSSLGSASDSMVGNANLVSKVYFPRLLLPLAGILAPLVDYCVAMLVLAGMIIAYGAHPSMGVLVIPLLIVLSQLTAFGVGTLLSALNVRYRDFRYVVPYLMQFWLFATPVAYSAQLVPQDKHVLLGFNPMATVVEAYRWALLGTPAPEWAMVCVSVGVTCAAVIAGVVYFQRVEQTFADII